MIKLVKPGFIAGKEKRFYNFMKNLGNAKVALISHVTDLDGVVSAKVVSEVIKPSMIKFVDYGDINENLSNELLENNITKVIFTDLMIESISFVKDVEKFADILIIDHHPIKNDYNSEKTVFMNAQGYCASYLSYYLFFKIKNIDYIDWLVACASVSDFFYFRNKNWMKKVYEKYNDQFITNKKYVRESGPIWDLIDVLNLSIVYFKPKTDRVFRSIGRDFGNIGDLRKYYDAVRYELFVVIKKFEEEKIEIKGGYFFEFECVFPIKSMLINTLSKSNLDKTLIIGEKKGDYYSLSGRRQDRKVDMNLLLKKLVNGFEGSTAGGHVPAAGANFPLKYLDEFKKRLKNI